MRLSGNVCDGVWVSVLHGPRALLSPLPRGQHDDGEFAIALKGIDFRERWRSTSMEELFLVTSATMPQDRPGRLDDEMYADILAYVLQENRTEPGTEELPPDPQALLAMARPTGLDRGEAASRPTWSYRRPRVGRIRWTASDR